MHQIIWSTHFVTLRKQDVFLGSSLISVSFFSVIIIIIIIIIINVSADIKPLAQLLPNFTPLQS